MRSLLKVRCPVCKRINKDPLHLVCLDCWRELPEGNRLAVMAFKPPKNRGACLEALVYLFRLRMDRQKARTA